jgi:hypothetical protein
MGFDASIAIMIFISFVHARLASADVGSEANAGCGAAAVTLPAKRTRKVVEARDGGSATVSADVSVSGLGHGAGADQFGRHVEEIPESIRADGSKTRARKRVVYTS